MPGEISGQDLWLSPPLASPHLRDALKQHRKFGQLSPDIKTHILTQTINLLKIREIREGTAML